MVSKATFFDFKPIFRVTDAVYICTKKVPIEDSRYILKFLLRTHPFSKYYKKPSAPTRQASAKSGNVQKSYIHNQDSINKIITKEINSLASPVGNTQFNDQKTMEKISEFLNIDLSKTDKAKLNLLISSRRGYKLQQTILDSTNAERATSFVRNDRTVQRNYGDYYLSGRVDAIDTRSKTVLEIKTRSFIDHSKSKVRLYDMVQCLCYMNLVEYGKCVLVESDARGDKRISDICFNEAEFNELVHLKLLEFINRVGLISESNFVNMLRKNSLL